MSKIVTPAMQRFQKRNKGRNEKSISYWGDVWRRYRKNPTAMIGLIVVCFIIICAVLAPVIEPYDYAATDYSAMCNYPSLQHPFGTDNLGRDLFSRCLYGARYSLGIGFACMILSVVFGCTVGLIASYFGGWVDNLIMRIVDIFSAIPGTLMSITIVATLGNGLPQLLVAITLGLTCMLSKVTRAAVFTVRGNDFVESSRAIGANNLRLMFRHILPNAAGHIIITAVGTIAAGIMIVSTLSYIGLGIQPPTPEWGALLNAGKGYITTHPYMLVFPGVLILITVLCLNLIGNGLRDALDPRLK